MPITPLSNAVIMISRDTHRAAGAALAMMLKVKLPRTIFLFGCKASTNEGKPTVSALISDRCIGWKGYVMWKNTKNTDMMIEYIVLTRYSDELLSILLIERLPSATTWGIQAKSLLTSTS